MADAALRPPDDAQPTGLTTPPPAYGPPGQVTSRPAQAAPVVAAVPAAPAPVTPIKRQAPAKAARHPARAAPSERFCDLCGTGLDDHSGHYHMVSPLTARKVAVCRTCRRAALSEGYRPRA